MISHLRIQNLLLVEDTELALSPGLNVLSGSTGSGKSVLLASLAILGGEKARKDWIGPFDKPCKVSALFQLSPEASSTFHELGVIEEGEEEISLSREILPTSRGRAFVNARPVSVATLRALRPHLFQIQDQHAQLKLCDAREQKRLLDEWAGNHELLASYRNSLETLDSLVEEQKVLQTEIATLRKEEEYLRFQLDEIQAAQALPDEIEDLEQKEKTLRNAGKVQELLLSSLNNLEGEEGLRRKLLALDRSLGKLSDLGTLKEIPHFQSLFEQIDELSLSLNQQSDTLKSEALDSRRIQERLGILHSLERKHGKSLEDLIAWTSEQENRLENLPLQQATLRDLDSSIREASLALSESAFLLSDSRREASLSLSENWQAAMRELGMESASLRIQVDQQECVQSPISRNNRHYQYSSDGMDEVQVMVQPNPELPEGRLRDVPSGGELSRMALAWRLLPSTSSDSASLLLDEVDAGLGADLAPALARQLKSAARSHQILLVTHQAALAVIADQQFQVRKERGSSGARVEVLPLEEDSRLAEIERMLGGQGEREIRDHARSLLESHS
ncbi:MAG: AAA family ATPase [Candidatus Krumholzibacteria bacterium]|nr:AAA family ATPase [Candidatus Krumholzibacteria bacterium]MDP6669163.1 AAA family ATPase [Candidatus Krumholzibacteria bacterium]MDP6797411.1 AAA family ATPase [Candidatus Krumholzibacteria bacterium]MDP7020869.1 AAA family ATPase [Candidatus Krumholzibacteria bacterium]